MVEDGVMDPVGTLLIEGSCKWDHPPVDPLTESVSIPKDKKRAKEGRLPVRWISWRAAQMLRSHDLNDAVQYQLKFAGDVVARHSKPFVCPSVEDYPSAAAAGC